jgi:S-formylglutathione hydrolase FrmB
MINNIRYQKKQIFLLILAVLFSAFSGHAQITAGVSKNEGATAALVREYKLDSKLMARQMPYNLILPSDYDSEANKTVKYPVIYLLHGLTGSFDNWAKKTRLAEYAVKHQAIIVMPEGKNGWYSDSVTAANDQYESYIVKELIPEVDKNFRTIPERNRRFIAGLSMGGYGAIKFGLKYPQMFSLVGSFSGALGAASFTEKNAGGIGKSIDAIFGGEASENRKSNDIFGIIKEISPEKVKSLPFIYLDCGTEDFLFQNNRDFVELLIEKKIPHEFRQLPGKHDWVFWDSQVQEFLRLTQKFSR